MRYTTALMALFLITSVAVGCASRAPMAAPSLAPMKEMVEETAAPRQLTQNHFRTDRTGNISEEQLHEILDAPVFLEDTTRVGVVPVATAYEVDKELPLAIVPKTLSESLEKTGFFEVTTEVSTDWPKAYSVAGLRELAARYRVKYLLLYRHRFVERDYTNDWAWFHFTVIGGLIAPIDTLEAAGVLEATLFDVRTGTIMFTVFERVHGEETATVWQQDRKRRLLKERLLQEAADKLAANVSNKVNRLAAANPTRNQGVTKAAPSQPPAVAAH